MAQTCMITIDRKPGQALADFNPQSLTVAAGDIINWCNNDETDAHWPAPIKGKSDDWMDNPIPIKLPDQPSPTSQQQLSFSAATNVTYICALHPEETGTIIVQ
jgi:plastocyanin